MKTILKNAIIYFRIIARRGELQALGDDQTPVYEEVDVSSLQQIQPRSVGGEHVSLEALKELKIP